MNDMSQVVKKQNTVETLYCTIYYNKYFIELHIDKSTQYVFFYEYFNRNWSCYRGFLLYIKKKFNLTYLVLLKVQSDIPCLSQRAICIRYNTASTWSDVVGSLNVWRDPPTFQHCQLRGWISWWTRWVSIGTWGRCWPDRRWRRRELWSERQWECSPDEQCQSSVL